MKEKFNFIDEFVLDEVENKYYNYPFNFSEDYFNSINWEIFSNEFNILKNKQAEIEKISIESLINYAKKINFFNNEELNDLEFGIFDIKLKIIDSKITSYTASYGVDDNENAKIPWKDVYGVWNVKFENDKVVKVERQ